MRLQPVLLVVLCASSCASNPSLDDSVNNVGETVEALDSLLQVQGFEMWYPAEESVEPGEVWFHNENDRTRIHSRPESVVLDKPSKAAFLKGYSTATSSTSANLVAMLGLLGGGSASDGVGEIEAELAQLSVSRIDFSFGEPSIRRFSVGQLGTAELPADYGQYLREDNPKVISEIVQTSGMKISVQLQNAGNQSLALAKIENFLGLDLSSAAVGGGGFEWTVPSTEVFVFGVKYVPNELIDQIID